MNHRRNPLVEGSPSLAEASVQDIQLALIGRTQFNALDGRRVAEDLLAHREWWEAVLMDTYGLASSHGIPGAGLIKLRDLRHNIWNVDTLYILAADERSARRLAELGEQWLADSVIVYDTEETAKALGGCHGQGCLVTMWWD